MIPYGLNKNMSLNTHHHNECSLCNSEIGKRAGRSVARQSIKRELREAEEMMEHSNVIDSFSGPYQFLSNFYKASSFLKYKGMIWLTAEHAYQAMKSEDPKVWAMIAMIETPGRAKRAGKTIEKRADWDSVKVSIMEEILVAKFEGDEYCRHHLCDTYPAKLVEGNTWGDTFWGVEYERGEGENHLGRLLMKIRGNLLGLTHDAPLYNMWLT